MTLPARANSPAPTRGSKRLPSSVERALADALSLEHPDVPWSLPAILPSVQDLRSALTLLALPAVDARHAAWCFARLLLAFEPNGSKASAEETKLRMAVWTEANADLGNDLWSKATLAAVQQLKWMPKPAEFRALVDDELARRIARLARCRRMLAMAEAREAGGGSQGSTDSAPRREPASRLERLHETIRLYRKHGRVADAERVEENLAREEKRHVAEQA